MSTAGQAGQESRWLGMEPAEALEFCDRNGVVVRRNTTLDGETIGYHFSEGDAETRKQQGGSELKLALMRNWRDQCVAQVKGERNHPSIQIWTIENEFAFINLINLLGNSPNMDQYEAEITATHDAVRAADPTRPVMVDGGGALKDNTLGVAGDHYVATLDARYPDLRLRTVVEGGGRGRWKWDQKRPRFIGEDYYATGINPADYATWGGEMAFQGKGGDARRDGPLLPDAQRGISLGRALRGLAFLDRQRRRARAMGREQPARRAGARVGLDLRLRAEGEAHLRRVQRHPACGSDHLHPPAHGRWQGAYREDLHPPGGTRDRGEVRRGDPHARGDGRGRKAELILALSVGGKEIFRDAKTVSILPAPKPAAQPAGSGRWCWIRRAETTSCLESMGVEFGSGPAPSTRSRRTAEGAGGRARCHRGRRQHLHPACGARLGRTCRRGARPIRAAHDTRRFPPRWSWRRSPEEAISAPKCRAAEGGTAFIEDASHPALRGLKDKDFFTWGPGHRVFRNAYVKPTRGGKSLVQCGPRLQYSALVEVPVGKGVIYLCQLDLGGKLAANAVARQVLVNLSAAARATSWSTPTSPPSIEDEQLAEAVRPSGCNPPGSADALAAIPDADKKIALVSATPANLKLLAGDLAALEAFWQRGGTLMLCGLTPEAWRTTTGSSA